MKTVSFVEPERTSSLSITGRACALDCGHCGGHYLAGMRGFDSLVPPSGGKNGPASVLVSGGCDPKGAVPLYEHREKLAELARHYKLIAHTGLFSDERKFEELAPLFLAVSFDLPGDDDIIRDVYGIDATAADFKESFGMLLRHLPTYPHITLGVNGGALGGEYDALSAVVGHGAPALVVNIFIPTPGTRFANRSPPPLDEVESFLYEAKGKLGATPIYLGCMRPAGPYRAETDCLALDCGLERIVRPHRDAIRKAKEENFNVESRSECCII